MMATKNRFKGARAWAVAATNPGCPDPGNPVYVQLFADKEEARKILRESAKKDADELAHGRIEWHDDGTDYEHCEVCECWSVKSTYALQELIIK